MYMQDVLYLLTLVDPIFENHGGQQTELRWKLLLVYLSLLELRKLRTVKLVPCGRRGTDCQYFAPQCHVNVSLYVI